VVHALVLMIFHTFLDNVRSKYFYKFEESVQGSPNQREENEN
jgi:hypothetical protein